MEGSPYSGIIQLLRRDQRENSRPAQYFGTVTKERPLKVLVGGVEYESSNLLINASVKGSLREGDELLLLPLDPEDGQDLLILCKVVNPSFFQLLKHRRRPRRPACRCAERQSGILSADAPFIKAEALSL